MKHRPCLRVTHITETLSNIILSQLMYCAAMVKSGYQEYSVGSLRKKEGVLVSSQCGIPKCRDSLLCSDAMTKQEKSVKNISFITYA